MNHRNTAYSIFFISNFYKLILFENLFKPRQRRLAVYMRLTSSVSYTTSKQDFEQPAASFLVCSLIFIEYD
ncbi:S1 RNA-binding domain-containing protein [Streptococcus pneumoniae]|nr:S1 RNA-binding domain-containing protein [Streptococcus pneumoniae]VMH51450.1 S1 RNA-binding domain-containing protein [Streptococcus pneumoniae]VMU63657.1 S1 RNA-binding domain-containing protein [Streptococcus pneumoniae]VNN09157.1 S1 RNA-binding domain-containing protein [Streptococcus pneumoniae]VOK30181.1 S1 RNA-binding domain-containing protein [Streptococcus pneumoniae]